MASHHFNLYGRLSSYDLCSWSIIAFDISSSNLLSCNVIINAPLPLDDLRKVVQIAIAPISHIHINSMYEGAQILSIYPISIYEMLSAVVYSLRHDTTMLCGLRLTIPCFTKIKIWPPLQCSGGGDPISVPSTVSSFSFTCCHPPLLS